MKIELIDDGPPGFKRIRVTFANGVTNRVVESPLICRDQTPHDLACILRRLAECLITRERPEESAQQTWERFVRDVDRADAYVKSNRDWMTVKGDPTQPPTIEFFGWKVVTR